MAQIPEFEDAAVWVIWPAHLTEAEVGSAHEALVDAVPPHAPVVSAITERGDGASSRNPLIPVGVHVAKEVIKGATALIRDQYRANQEAKKSYDERAEKYLRENDEYFGRA